MNFLSALRRELLEELSIKIDLNKVIFLKNYLIRRNNKKILINFFICDKWYGKIKPMEHQHLKWITIEKLSMKICFYQIEKLSNI